ncbi:hypothetical protein KEM55_008674 [Ascosphaera atra]|nr:hypothetical protein KEM55_008674 [Ascosphaera atra]
MTKRKRSSSSPPSPPSLYHPVLSLSFPRVLSLRSYLIEHTPTPRARRRIRQRANDALATVLDTTLVGILDQNNSDSTFKAFRARESKNYAEPKARGTPLNMKQILDFALITLLTSAQYPRNILTQHVLLDYSPDPKPVEQIPNRHLSLLRNAPWSELPVLLGPGPASAEVLLGLLLECALFVPGGDDGALVQISGE